MLVPLQVAMAPGGGPWAETGTALTVTGAEVSAVYRRNGARIVRVFNPAGTETIVRLPGERGAVVNLRGDTVEQFDESFALRPWGIATLQLSD